MKNYFEVLKHIKNKGFNCWLIGSAVRDVIMRRVPVAFSIVVDAPSFEVLIENFGGEIVKNRNFNYVQSEIYGESAQMSLLEGKTIKEELSTRDFTINAIAIRWDGFIEDPFYGRHDIRNRLVRIINDDTESFEKKPLRVARLLRFAVHLDMNIYWKSEMDTRIYIENHKDVIKNSMSPRWGREIFISMKEKPYDMLRLADHYGLVPLLMSKVEALKEINIADGGGTLFSHTLDTLKEIQDYIQRRNPTDNDLIITLVALFHHVGSTPGIPVEASVSSAITEGYLKAWGAEDDVTERVLTVMKEYRLFYTDRSEQELCNFALDNGFDTIRAIGEFCQCNINVSVGAEADERREKIVQNNRRLREIFRRFDEMWYKMGKPNRYINREDIVKKFGSPTPEAIKAVTRRQDELVGVGDIISRRDALNWLDGLEVSQFTA